MDAQFRRQELERFRDDFPPMSATEDKGLEELSSRTIAPIIELLGRELREIPEQDRLTPPCAACSVFHSRRRRSRSGTEPERDL